MAGMKYRKLRIAWSVAWGVACLLLIALWVRSYYIGDSINTSTATRTKSSIASMGGVLTILVSDKLHNTDPWRWTTHYAYVPSRQFTFYGGSDYYLILEFPHWLSVAFTVVLSAIPWLSLRFSLRTLLIGMTVAAIGLGRIVYALRG